MKLSPNELDKLYTKDDITIDVFYKVLGNGDYELLKKTKCSVNPLALHLHFYDICIDLGVFDLDIYDKQKEYLASKIQFALDSNNTNSTMYNIKMAEYNKLIGVETKPVKLPTKELAILSKFMGFRINPKEVTMFELITYRDEFDNHNKAMKNGRKRTN